jgi:hypothetical protein
MKTLILLLIFISYTYADIDPSTLTSLRTLGKIIANFIYEINYLTSFRSLEYVSYCFITHSR